MEGYIYGNIQKMAAVIEDNGSSVSNHTTIIVVVFAILIVLGLLGLWAFKSWPKVKGWVFQFLGILISLLLPDKNKNITKSDIDEIIKESGYAYDDKKDIFYSRLDAWQRKFGYCRLYDEAAAPLGMIIDCEPVIFEYDKRQWMIEFWKGQYDYTTGCEVGIYVKSRDIYIDGVFQGAFYDCVDDIDMIDMSYTLKKNGEVLFKRRDKHWWLTGFKLGEFSEPEELSMNINLRLKDKNMANAFAEELIKIGYKLDEISISGNSVSVYFGTPKTRQPISRTPKVSYLTQWKNKLICHKYQQITKDQDTMLKKLEAVRSNVPEIFKIMMDIGRRKAVFAPFNKIEGN